MNNYIFRRSPVAIILAIMLIAFSMITAFGILISCKKLEVTQRMEQGKFLNKSMEAVVTDSPILEAEEAVLSGAVIASNRSGYTGSGFADYVMPPAILSNGQLMQRLRAHFCCNSDMQMVQLVAAL